MWSHERLGDLAWRGGDSDRAREHFELQAALAEQLIERGLTRGSLWAKACSLGQLETLASHESDDQLGYDLSERRNRVLDRLGDLAPNDSGFRRVRATAYATHSFHALRIGKAELALHSARRATELAWRQFREDPTVYTPKVYRQATKRGHQLTKKFLRV